MQPILNIALRAARQSSEYIVQAIDRREPTQINDSSDAKLLGQIEEVIYNDLFENMKRAHPTHFIYRTSEAPRSLDDRDDTWEVKALHSAKNLLHKLPDTAFSFVHRHKGKLQDVVVVNPMTQDEYTASRGNGASLNGRRLRCSATRALDQANLLGNLVNQFKQVNAPHALEGFISDLAKSCLTMRDSGCDLLDLCRVCAGQADGMLSLNVEHQELDAAYLIAQESGLLTGTLAGSMLKGNTHSLVAANPKLFKSLVQRYAGWESKLA